MTETTTPPPPEQLALLTRVARDITRMHRLPPADAEDFIQSVQLHVLERDYEVFRRFHGRSSLRTYLTVVVTRLLLDDRNRRFGRWRPSAPALKLGPQGVELERLITRDGYTPAQAVERLAMNCGAAIREELWAMVGTLPNRPRRQMVSEESLESTGVSFDDPVEAEDRQRRRARIGAALAKALAQLSADDRRLLALRFHDQQRIATLARHMRTDPQTLYRRFARILRALRRSLAHTGIDATVLLDAR
jgi:RNA polymerase sigma factor for flagellar operon FliA